jgi:hypothetical protein
VLKVDIQQFYDMLDKGHLLTFERAHDTKRVLAVLPKRFAKYGLRLHPDKTRLFPFHRPGIGHPIMPTTGSPAMAKRCRASSMPSSSTRPRVAFTPGWSKNRDRHQMLLRGPAWCPRPAER